MARSIENTFCNITSFSVQFVDKNTDAVSSSTYYGHNASRAVDGNFDQKIENCSHTDDICGNDEHAWLRIDLKQEYSIKSVKIWYRADSKYHIFFITRIHII